MSSMGLIRITNGMLILAGMLFFKPLLTSAKVMETLCPSVGGIPLLLRGSIVYFVAIMMIIAGLTGFCLLEKVFNKFGIQGKCALK